MAQRKKEELYTEYLKNVYYPVQEQISEQVNAVAVQTLER